MGTFTRRVTASALALAGTMAVGVLTAAPASATTVTGPCGTASLYMTDVVGDGFTKFTMRITGVQAPIAEVAYHLRWFNHTTGRTGTLIDDSFAFTNSWYQEDVEDVGVGYVSVEGYYSSLQTNGSVCYSAPGLYDGEYVY